MIVQWKLRPPFHLDRSDLIPSQWLRWIALFLVGLWLQIWVHLSFTSPGVAQSTPTNSCAAIVAPLTPQEMVYAKAAWKYFEKNYQPSTGFANSVGGYPSGSLWDIGNYLMALNTARWLNLIGQKEFDERLNKFLVGIGNLKLFEDSLPNKVYHAATGKMVDYGNNEIERGIGWSALDIGRILAAFHIIGVCHPQYIDWMKGVLAKWDLARSVKDGQLFGATVLPDKKTLLVQEGRLGYEEYAVRGYELWGFKASKALSFQPYKFVNVYGVQIPVDLRDYQSTSANNYVVSESYILDGIEFGLEGDLADYAARVLQAQEQRYLLTNQLTAVSEDNIDQAPYFLYNTVHSNGVNWATITDENKPYPDLRTISTKAAFGWHYLYPTNQYAKKVFDAVKDLRSPDGDGFYAGLYEVTKKPNKVLTGNTNGLILEILHYKALGNRPLIPRGTSLPSGTAATPGSSTPVSGAIATPIPPVDDPKSSQSLTLSKPLSIIERRYAKAAWQYFEGNLQSSGLVNDQTTTKGATLWGLGNYLMALHCAHALGIVELRSFDQQVRNLLGTLAQLPLSMNELPHRSYNTWSLQPVDYGNNPTPEGTGWSGLDVARMLTALQTLKTYHPEYTEAIDKLALDWSYLRVVRDGLIYRAVLSKDDRGRMIPRVILETRLGYEEYAARAFQMWGFEMKQAAVGGEYQRTNVEGESVPVQRIHPGLKATDSPYTISTPFLFYGLEYGFDPQMRSLVTPLLKAQAARYRRTQILTAAATTINGEAPYVIHSTIVGKSQPWSVLDDLGKEVNDRRVVSTGTAFGWRSLFPEDAYARDLRESVTDLYSAAYGFYEGFYEKTGKPVLAASGTTNALILESLLYQATQKPLILPVSGLDSPWWRTIREGDSGRGLPTLAKRKAEFVSEASGSYWISSGVQKAEAPAHHNSVQSIEPPLAKAQTT